MANKKFFKLINNENIIASNLISKCEECFNNCILNYKPINCPIDKESRRQGKLISGDKIVFLCSSQESNSKLFKQKIDSLLYTFNDINIVRSEIENSVKKTEQQKINRLVHNLASINAYNIQSLYDLVPQELLSTNWRDQLHHIQNELQKDVTWSSKIFLRLIKNSIQMKSEFSIYRKLDRENNVQLDLNYHPIRKVVLNILHTFFSDLNDKQIIVKVGAYNGRVMLDYETIQVALYHLIENATKYMIPNSEMNIDFEDTSTYCCCSFSMNSLFVTPDEREKIFLEGYSGHLAKKTLKSGDGIGLWRIKQIMELNNGKIECVFSNTPQSLNGFQYGINVFKLFFSK